MKFAHYIAVLERDAPPQWRGKFLRYKLLKKKLKRCLSECDPALEDAFFADLQTQLASINRNFQNESERTVAAFDRIVKGGGLWCCFWHLWRYTPHHYAALADRAYWCRKYARANAVALRKILKKHDKVCGNERGRTFLQQCWCSTSAQGIGLFLHSPLLDELKAVQDVLHHKMQEANDHEEVQMEEPQHSQLKGVAPAGGDDIIRTPAGGNTADNDASSMHASSRDISVRDGLAGPTPLLCHGDDDEDAGNVGSAAVPQTSSVVSFTTADLVVSMPLCNEPRPALHRQSPSTGSYSSDGLRGAAMNAPPSGPGSIGSMTTPSLRAQRAAALAAIAESPHNLLDSSDYDWERDPASTDSKDGAVDQPQHHHQKPRQQPQHQQQQRYNASQIRDETTLQPRTSAADGTIFPVDLVSLPEAGGIATSDVDHLAGGAMHGVDPDAPTARPKQALESGTTATVHAGGASPRGGPEAAAGPAGGSDEAGGGGGSSGVGPVLGPFRDDELRCPVCLDIMYKPVGLGCGHKFCKPCALEAAGFGRASGSFRNIASYVPPRTPCPTCRQTHVYRAAVSLKEVGALIQSRYPEQWAERKAEERRKLMGRYPSVPQPAPSNFRGASPFELLTGSSTDIHASASQS